MASFGIWLNGAERGEREGEGEEENRMEEAGQRTLPHKINV